MLDDPFKDIIHVLHSLKCQNKLLGKCGADPLRFFGVKGYPYPAFCWTFFKKNIPKYPNIGIMEKESKKIFTHSHQISDQ